MSLETKSLIRLGLLFTCFVVLFTGFQCSSAKTTDWPKNTTSTEKEMLETTDDSKRKMQAFVRELSHLYGIENLHDTTRNKSDLEVRLWSSTESDYAKCILIRRHWDGVWNAQLVSPKFHNGLVVKTDDGHIDTVTVPHLRPKSGWKWLEDYFTKKDVSVPLRHKVDTAFAPSIPDEGAIGLEIKHNEQYDVIFYRFFTESPDGKVVKEICKEVENQFSQSLGCAL